MFVRVYDKPNGRYYKSMVYAEIGEGWFGHFIVLDPSDDYFKLVEYFDKSVKPAQPLVEAIDRNYDDFEIYENDSLLKFKHYCEKNGIVLDFNRDFSRLFGYADICENFDFIIEIWNNRSVPYTKYPFQLHTLPDIEQWQYIRSQEDANKFMKIFMGFHDTTLDKLIFEEKFGYTKATATFNNYGWRGIVELCFEGVQDMHIRPAKESETNCIFSATLLVHDETIFWADDELDNEDLSYNGTFIKALNLKWRKAV